MLFFIQKSDTCRKQKSEIIGTKRTIPADVDSSGKPIEPDDAADETVFSATLAPKELYSELLHSYSATGIIDLSPGQGELVKASLLSRTKCLVLAGTDKHAAALELAATDFLLQELRREGSTFYRAEAAKKDDNEEEATKPPKRSEKKKTKTEEEECEVPKKKKAKVTKTKEENEAEAEEPQKKKPKKGKTKAKTEEEDEEAEDDSSELW